MRHSLRPGRIAEIVESLELNDYNTFSCHKTIDYSNTDEQGELLRTKKEQVCFGSIVYLQRVKRPSVSQRLAYMTGKLKPEDVERLYPEVIDQKDVEEDAKCLNPEHQRSGSHSKW
jgi:predicted transcriptional regulator of viral defense system